MGVSSVLSFYCPNGTNIAAINNLVTSSALRKDGITGTRVADGGALYILKLPAIIQLQPWVFASLINMSETVEELIVVFFSPCIRIFHKSFKKSSHLNQTFRTPPILVLPRVWPLSLGISNRISSHEGWLQSTSLQIRTEFNVLISIKKPCDFILHLARYFARDRHSICTWRNAQWTVSCWLATCLNPRKWTHKFAR